MLKGMNKDNSVFAFHRQDIVCVLCASIVSLTMNLYPDDIPVNAGVWIRIILGTVIHFYLLKFGFGFLYKTSLQNVQLAWDKKAFQKRFIILCIIFLMPLIIYYPGVNGWDTEYQLIDLFDGTQVMHRDSWGDYYVTYTLSDHMNLFDTFLFGGFVKLGMIIGNASFGVFLYCVLQAVLFSAVCSLTIGKLMEWGANRRVVIICFLFYALSPFIWMYSINMIKDSINAALFVLYFIKYIEILRKKEKAGWGILILTLLVCLTKKTGIIIIVPSNIILTITLWKNGERRFSSFAITFTPILLISVLLQKVIYPMFDIYQDGLQEMFAFSFQQIARVVKYAPDSFSTLDGAVIDKILDYRSIAALYDYNLVDGVKDTFRPMSTSSDFMKFIELWLKQGIAYPLMYVKSLIGTNGGFFSPTHKINIYTIFNDWGNLGISVQMWASKARVAFFEFYNMLTDIPVLGVLFQIFFYSWILVCFTAWKAVKDRSKRLFLCFIPVYISVITFLLSPDVNARYALHIIMVSPIMYSIGKFSVEENKKEIVEGTC